MYWNCCEIDIILWYSLCQANEGELFTSENCNILPINYAVTKQTASQRHGLL